MKLVINIDGGCRGNPGPGSSAVVIRDESGVLIAEAGRYLGPLTTNNKAEFTALFIALKAAKEIGGSELDIRSDSLLLVKQYKGEFRVKNAELALLLGQINTLSKKFISVKLSHVRREFNKEADALANRVLDSSSDIVIEHKQPKRAEPEPANLPPAPAAEKTQPAKKGARIKKSTPKPADDGPEQLMLF